MAAGAKGRSVLFLSADLVGSTSYKQKEKGVWQGVFLSFYRQFPQYLSASSREHDQEAVEAPDFRLWKAVGDELIYEVTVTHEQEVSRAIRIWLMALELCETDILQEASLGLKGSAFIATFPGPDSEATIPRNPKTEKSDLGVVTLNDAALKPKGGVRSHSRYQFDYFGPSIDTGFRVSSHASHRYFTMSVEASWALALAAAGNNTNSGRDDHLHVKDVVFRGNVLLKGVWDGREYPLFAIDRHFHDGVNKSVAKLVQTPPEAQDIIDVCHACNSDDNWPCAIYLPASSNVHMQVEPEDAMATLRASEQTSAGFEKLTKGASGGGKDLKADPPLS
ncbi:hypothetical protein [Microbacterium sp. GbtcB4]|uniref:hypothetical protein n=1 Tax=Microbacterium sp. GbtcB4 TaxID=2824749 RepID=UPI001C2FB486